jgi:EAL domain-containing protein (putative c-di-GMP-specific phosphodiesterase class I)
VLYTVPPADPDIQTPLKLLLVSESDRWGVAVRGAAADIGADVVETRASSRAMSLLVSRIQNYSHLLLEPACAGGLMNELVGLTSGEASSGTRMLLLGASHGPPQVGLIAAATRRSVARAIAPRRAARRRPFNMDPSEILAASSAPLIETRYQPIVRLDDGRVVGIEALARLNHPVQGTIPPGHFVPQIEAAGLGGKLTDRVAGIAFADLAAPGLAGHDLFVAMNLPLDVLLLPKTRDQLDERREAVGLDANRILIELTESRPVGDVPALRKAVARLREAGYAVAIDDAAPTIPHHAALMALPFTTVKLDKSVVQASAHDEAVRDFLERTLVDARDRGLTVIAEGVEDDVTWRRMRDAGVCQAQGFLISRPLPRATVPVWLKTWDNRRSKLG